MPIINLKKYYYPAYTKDTFVEVSDEVAEALLLMGREENTRKSKIYYHKAYFSLDYGEGIENAALDFVEKSPEEILMEKEDEWFYLLTLQRLSEAIDSLTPLQASHLHARYTLGIKAKDMAEAEGVSVAAINGSISRAIKNLRKYFEKHNWKEFEE